MTDPFETEEEWVELCDSNGKRASMRHLATISFSGKVYHVLGSAEEDEENGLLLVREDRTVDGVQEYVIAEDEHEIEDVVGRFVMHSVMRMIERTMQETSEGQICPCGMTHRPGEFCVCDDPEYLQ